MRAARPGPGNDPIMEATRRRLHAAQRRKLARKRAAEGGPERAWVDRRDGTREYLEIAPTAQWNLWVARPTEGRTITVVDGDYLGAGPMEPGWKVKFDRVFRDADTHAYPRGGMPHTP